MKANRFWIEIVAMAAAIAFALALLIATLGAAAAAVSGQNEAVQNQPPQNQPVPTQPGQAMPAPDASKTYQGMVTCSHCRAKHPAELAKTATDCILTCVRGGSTFALVDGDKIYQLDGDLTIIKKVAGQRAAIVGVERGNTITVSSVSSLASAS
jgi:uncharacterized iron-regulated membrane protein